MKKMNKNIDIKKRVGFTINFIYIKKVASNKKNCYKKYKRDKKNYAHYYNWYKNHKLLGGDYSRGYFTFASVKI
jgi:hypothetical protein